nr:translation initiation factor IF-2-like [Aegilops tauschii subsp. strangulata]
MAAPRHPSPARLSDSSRIAPAPSIRAGSGARPRGTPSPDAAPSPLTTTSSASPPRLAPTSPRASPAPCRRPGSVLEPRAARRPCCGGRATRRRRPPSLARPCHGLLLTGPHHRPSPRPPHLLLADDTSPSSSPKVPPSLAAPCSPTQIMHR